MTRITPRLATAALAIAGLGCSAPEPPPPVSAPPAPQTEVRPLPWRPEWSPAWTSATSTPELELRPFSLTKLSRVKVLAPVKENSDWQLAVEFSNPGPPAPLEAEFQDAEGARLGWSRWELPTTQGRVEMGLAIGGPEASAAVARVSIGPGGKAPGDPVVDWEHDARGQALTLVRHGDDVTRPTFVLRNDGPPLDAVPCVVSLLTRSGGEAQAWWAAYGPVHTGTSFEVARPEVTFDRPARDAPWRVRLTTMDAAHPEGGLRSAEVIKDDPAYAALVARWPAERSGEALLPTLTRLKLTVEQPRSVKERWRAALQFENAGGALPVAALFKDAAGATLGQTELTLPPTPAGTLLVLYLIGPPADAPVAFVQVRPTR